MRTGPWHQVLRERRQGVMLHYDASRSDKGALSWLRDPACKVSYHWLIWDDGVVHEIAPMDARAWHGGACRPSNPAQLPYRDANSAFYGIAIAATAGDTVTEAQLAAVVTLVATLFRREGWPLTDSHRLVGHDTEAYRRGRKTDPTGPNPARPVLSVAEVRRRLLEAA